MFRMRSPNLSFMWPRAAVLINAVFGSMWQNVAPTRHEVTDFSQIGCVKKKGRLLQNRKKACS